MAAKLIWIPVPCMLHIANQKAYPVTLFVCFCTRAKRVSFVLVICKRVRSGCRLPSPCRAASVSSSVAPAHAVFCAWVVRCFIWDGDSGVDDRLLAGLSRYGGRDAGGDAGARGVFQVRTFVCVASPAPCCAVAWELVA